ncbi:PAS domain S-box protein [Carboxylicivirga caseinilyticus]|uniref:PAS domain-containing sensor histidine kinase n=1 Tax=Carboxylicivirga caseinilyticus TaxID=3417572 RepID=UPI003D34D204|nr:PAS domain S-box protein [Marinilabiliaceae bacterium A049]
MQSEIEKSYIYRIQELEKEIERLKDVNIEQSQLQSEKDINSMAFKLSEMAKLANVGFWEYDVENDNVIWSDETYRLFDYEIGSKINYESILNRIHPDDKEKHNINTQQWIEKGICNPFEYRIVLPNGLIKYVIAKGKIEKNNAGATIKMLGAITDITKQKETEFELLDYQGKLEENVAKRTLELESKQHLLSTVISEASVILFALDSEGIFTLSDGKGLKKLGLQPGQVVGMSALELYKDNPAIISSIKSVFDGNEVRIVNQVGEIYFDTSYTPLISDKKVIGVVGVATDITELKQTEKSLKAALEYNQKMTDTSPVGIIVVDKQGQFEFANSRAEKKLGLKKEDITGMTYNHPDWKITDFEGNDFPQEELPFIRVQKEGKPVHCIEHAIKWPDGSMIYLSINAAPKFDANNNFDGMIATLENITNRVLRERELKEVFSFREMLIKNAAEGLCVCHNIDEFPYVEFTVWNNQIEKITGYTLNEINELGWYQSLYKDLEIRERAIQRMTSMREGEDIVNEEWDITTKNNEPKTISISTSIINSLKGTTHVLALISDVTELKKQRESIKKHNEELERLNEIKNRFLSILSHDLKAPMGAQMHLLDIITKDSSSFTKEELLRYIGVFSDSNKSSYNLLDNILNWVILQIGNGKVLIENCSLKKSIDEIKNIFKENLLRKDIKVLTELECDIIETNKNILNTLLRNLICNAIKFSERDGAVTIISRKVQGEIIISVKDTGVGMDSSTRDSLFNFEKTISKKGTNHEIGTGLGLSICNDLIISIGGKIWVESEVGKGSIFNFSIPNQ